MKWDAVFGWQNEQVNRVSGDNTTVCSFTLGMTAVEMAMAIMMGGRGVVRSYNIV